VITASNTTNAFPAGSLRPNVSGDPSLPSDQRTVQRWFDTSIFSQPANFTFGNAPRSLLRGAPIVSTDATLEKSFFLTERWKLTARILQPPEPRDFQYPRRHLRRGGFGVVSRTPRAQVQLAARLSF
jgi:hypothetical protein